MRKLLVLLIAVAAVCNLYAQETASERYYRLYIENAGKSEALEKEYNKQLGLLPKKSDSLRREYSKLRMENTRELIRIAIENAADPGALTTVYYNRQNISKDTLRMMLNSIPDDIRTSPQCEALEWFINNDPIGIGDKYYDFEFIDSEDNKSKFSDLEGKKILLVYSETHLIKRIDATYLDRLQEKMADKDVLMIFFQPASNKHKLDEAKRFAHSFRVISDLKGDFNAIAVGYGAQQMPLTLMIDESGIIVKKFTGIPSPLLDSMLF